MKWTVILTVSLFSIAGMGQMKGKQGMMSAEMHEKMAKFHTDMADCLKKEKSQEKCQMKMKDRKTMMCEEMGMDHMKDCPMMGMMTNPQDGKKTDDGQGKSEKENEHEEHH